MPPNWSRPTILRPQLCGCELVFVLDDNENSDPRGRDNSMRLVKAVIAHEPSTHRDDSPRRGLVEVREHGNAQNRLHGKDYHVGDHWNEEILESKFCEHHEPHGHQGARDAVLAEGWLFNDAVAELEKHLPQAAHEIGRVATMDENRILQFSFPAETTIAKRRLEARLAEKLGPGRVKVV